MKAFPLVFVLATLVTGVFVVGCDRTVSEDTKVQKRTDGSTVKDSSKTTKSPDGGVTNTTEHKESK